MSIYRKEKEVGWVIGRGLTIGFFLYGPRGCVQLWASVIHVPGSEEFRLLPHDFGYHTHWPQYDDQRIRDEKCKRLGGRPCYYDGSSLVAQKLFATLCDLGELPVWLALQEKHDSLRIEGDE